MGAGAYPVLVMESLTNVAAASLDGPSLGLRLALGLILLIAGLAVAYVGVRGLRGSLPRNRFAGVRTPASMRDDDTFRIANQVAGAPVIGGGVLAVLCAATIPAMPTTAAVITVTVIAAVGLLLLVGAGGVLGHRAASAVPEPRGRGCGGCCGGVCSRD